jgi:hypothetical protein
VTAPEYGFACHHDPESGRFTDHNGITWAPGQQLPELASPALRQIAYRMAAWNNASTYPWKTNVWQSWMGLAEAMEEAAV